MNKKDNGWREDVRDWWHKWNDMIRLPEVMRAGIELIFKKNLEKARIEAKIETKEAFLGDWGEFFDSCVHDVTKEEISKLEEELKKLKK